MTAGIVSGRTRIWIGTPWEPILGLLLGLSLVRGMLYSALIPPWQAPDEPKHFEYVRLLYEKRRLVREEDTSLAIQTNILSSMHKHEFWKFAGSVSKVPEKEATSFAAMGWTTELDRPPLYYLLHVPLYAIVSQEPITVQLYVMRLVPTVLGMLTVLMAFLATRELFPNGDFLIIGVPALVTFLPMHTFLAGSVNSDNLAILLASSLVFQLILGLKKGFTWRRTVLIALLVISGLVTKRTTVFTIPLVAALIPLQLFERKDRIALNWTCVGLILFVIGTALLLGLIGFHLLQDGQMLDSDRLDPLQSKIGWMLSNYYADSSFRGSISALMQQDYFSVDFLGLCGLYLKSMFKGFWANFGWAYLKLAPVWYRGLAITTLLAVGGLLSFGYKAVKRLTSLASWQMKGLLIYLLAVCLIVIQTISRQITISRYCAPCQPQGRYLLPAIVPIASLFVLGLREIAPPRYRKLWLFAVICGLIALDLVSFMRYMIPFFYG